MPSPLLSVIIPTFNRAASVVNAVQSVIAQTLLEIEIIVVDDGSTDGTAELLECKFGDCIKCLRLPCNRGVSYARNRGIELSRGAYIAFLDSDDFWFKEKSTLQLAFMRERPELLISQTDEIWIRNGKRVNPCQHHLKPSGSIFAECLPLCVVSPSAVMMRRKFFATVGLFDEQLPACEDYDLWLRTACRYPIELLPGKLLTKFGGHSDQLSHTTPALDRYRIKALIKLLRRHQLTLIQKEQTLAILQKKSKIYLKGCRKRGRIQEAETLEKTLTEFI